MQISQIKSIKSKPRVLKTKTLIKFLNLELTSK